MNIAVLVHSLTGTTHDFARLLAERLRTDGHTVTLVRIETDHPVKSGTIAQPPAFTITNLPDVAGYDLILAGGPVWGFSISPVIHHAVECLGDLTGKRFLPFVTMGFFARGMGGTRSVRQLAAAAAKKGATCLKGSVAPKMFRDLAAEMEKECELVSRTVRRLG